MQGQNVFAPGQPAGYTIPTNRPKDWFSYPIRLTAFALNAVVSTSIQIDAGSDFYLTALSQFAQINASTAVLTTNTYNIPAATVLITDSGSNRQLMQNPVPLPLIAGTGDCPHRLIYPRLFLRNSNIQVQITSFDSTTYSNLWINLEGFRIYL